MTTDNTVSDASTADSAMLKSESEPENSKDARKAKKNFIKDAVTEHGLYFTYIRNRTDGGVPFRHGGAVVCWKMPEFGNKSRIVAVSIAWCHDNELFDKVEGRYAAVKNYLYGRVADFKLAPGRDSISSRIVEVFNSGFMV